MDKKKIGIVGTSQFSQNMYFKNLKNHDLGYINAICGSNPDRTKKIAEEWGFTHYYTDYIEMVESGNIDALIVVTPNYLHHPITMSALKNDLHVMCEKPLAMNY